MMTDIYLSICNQITQLTQMSLIDLSSCMVSAFELILFYIGIQCDSKKYNTNKRFPKK